MIYLCVYTGGYILFHRYNNEINNEICVEDFCISYFILFIFFFGKLKLIIKMTQNEKI